jgi:hypothetical protein
MKAPLVRLPRIGDNQGMPCPGKGAFEAYARGALAHQVAAEVRAHSQTCPVCRLRLAEATAKIAGVEAHTDPLPPRPDVRVSRKNRQVHFYDSERDETLPSWQQPKRARVSCSAAASSMANTISSR